MIKWETFDQLISFFILKDTYLMDKRHFYMDLQ